MRMGNSSLAITPCNQYLFENDKFKENSYLFFHFNRTIICKLRFYISRCNRATCCTHDTFHEVIDSFPCHNSLSHSETTWTAQETMCWAWRGWLKTYWRRSPTSWSPTWRAEALSRTPSHRLTRPATSPRPTPSEPHTQLHVGVGQGYMGTISKPFRKY